MMLTHLCIAFSHSSFITLPYGLYLTKICHFGVNILRKETSTLHYTYTYQSWTGMGYTMDQTWKAYHHCINAQDIYVYTRDTLNVYLPEGYSSSDIPPVDEDDNEVKVDEAGPSNIALPFDDPLATDLDLPHWHRPNRSYIPPFY